LNKFFKSYGFSITLIVSIVIGSLVGMMLKEKAQVLKPFGDIFLNLLFTLVVPLVFFSISSAVAVMSDLRRLGKIMGWMIVIFVLTGIVSSLVMVAGVCLFHPAEGLDIKFESPRAVSQDSLSQQLVKAFTVGDFSELLSRKNMLALIVFALLVGVATSAAGEQGTPFLLFLTSGATVMGKAIGYVMLYAPVGLGAYFACLVGVFGPQLLGTYARVVLLYYPLTILYFGVAFSIYAWLAGGSRGMRAYWKNILPAALTAWGTGSSLATIPTNLEAARRIGIPRDIREVVIPIGATIHMDGSCLAAVLKMAVLFGIFHMEFSGVSVILGVIAVAILSGTVISGIPAGGMLGEMLIITMFGFPIEALPVITMIGTLVDPPATMVNSTGDTVASMLVARILNGKDWIATD
jgi:Na+/H+-dicarboxylate symporter